MLYYFLEYINKTFNPPGFDVFRFLTFRSALAAISALLISLLFAPRIIRLLQKNQIGEAKKADGPKNHWSKAGTPTMGGLIIISSIVIPVLLWSDIKSVYIILVLAGTVWLSLVGFLDDYLKVVKKLPNGLIARYKLLGQVIIGLVVGIVIWYSPEFAGKSTLTTIPFLKDMNFDFSFFYIPVVIFIVTATSNAVNLTDGLDGLAIGNIMIVMIALAIISYVSGNVRYADYLNIMYLRGSGELTVFIAAVIGASLGFLWYNFYPAQVFMGDTGSLALGGALGILVVLIKKEFLLPILGGIFFIETVSVIIQRVYFKYTKKKYGAGRRVFKMAPIHHHFEMLGWPEPKIVMRFYIIAIILAIISLASFKIR
ncbi:MAG: phospho-N-acetylmuramoyl-pentapeptide-transferase [Ignavibacteria bacterium CG_4_8_14_3_um_filter_37_9]|nr:phospho-N-acetylmuramoyl-pentapeptide-transferase [Ignavibacteria bacterium]OIO22432.1 MAG: phospho-N-acetylmuramoyl-pentapeptide-transferase [Ignavibacteria bacterium CG1_02_37_35]PIP77466.1 MAG: phospho-N-acetylmuramoyl-pentapeptide-transferase [Ignavibacteria bacterium CG22_combo_CG10-13_8_21_14_all_37_15]PIS45332.1 MAG: phospho-N-acetylmuramoyl-pentapeptide-transferase [Ignavibacteria bacterium CG08_land_8_20_14_0_20_37_9]PIW99397.1 MAG: phospho-N-acetylmuramoyl-pentapeptide-transferase 